MSLYHVHMDDKLFPEPTKFEPQRWLANKELHKYLLPFGSGSRMCLGLKYGSLPMNCQSISLRVLRSLANAEIYTTIAAMVRSFDMELFETTRERDVDIKHDFFIGMADLASPGIRIKIAKALQG